MHKNNYRPPLNRRDFVARSGLFGAGFALGPSCLAAGSDQAKQSSTVNDTATQTVGGKMTTRRLGNREVSA